MAGAALRWTCDFWCWHVSDLARALGECPLIGANRKSRLTAPKSENNLGGHGTMTDSSCMRSKADIAAEAG